MKKLIKNNDKKLKDKTIKGAGTIEFKITVNNTVLMVGFINGNSNGNLKVTNEQ